jgi:hypothetical protein
LLGFIEELKLSPKQNEPIVAAVEDLRVKLANKMAEHGMEYTHRQLKQWVSGLLEQKQQVKGTYNETPISIYKEELHEIADGFLRERLKLEAAKHPDLKEALPELLQNNRDISAAVRVKDVVQNSTKLDHWKGKTLAEKVKQGVGRAVLGAGVAGAPGAIAGNVGLGTAGAIAGALAGTLAGGATAGVVNTLGRLQKGVKAGDLASIARLKRLDSSSGLKSGKALLSARNTEIDKMTDTELKTAIRAAAADKDPSLRRFLLDQRRRRSLP